MLSYGVMCIAGECGWFESKSGIQGMRKINLVACLTGMVILAIIGSAYSSDEKNSNVVPGVPDYLRAENNQPVKYTYKIINVFPHDSGAFTQGLVFENGFFYEGTGLYGRSSLRKIDPVTGKAKQSVALANRYFGEGITLLGERIIQLTWRSHAGFVYDRDTFTIIQQFEYSGEGWGITHDGRHLIMSDGSSRLRLLDPVTFKQVRSLGVHDGGVPVSQLNELEFIKGEIYANIWQTNQIAIINPVTGLVRGWIDLSGLLTPEEMQKTDVLNGIAYDRKGDRLFVTGKFWPKLFEIILLESKTGH